MPISKEEMLYIEPNLPIYIRVVQKNVVVEEGRMGWQWVDLIDPVLPAATSPPPLLLVTLSG